MKAAQRFLWVFTIALGLILSCINSIGAILVGGHMSMEALAVTAVLFLQAIALKP